jgi:hypothetical protein
MLPAQGEGRGSMSRFGAIGAFLVVLCGILLCALVAIK